jgi:hypothetical protein
LSYFCCYFTGGGLVLLVGGLVTFLTILVFKPNLRARFMASLYALAGVGQPALRRWPSGSRPAPPTGDVGEDEHLPANGVNLNPSAPSLNPIIEGEEANDGAPEVVIYGTIHYDASEDEPLSSDEEPVTSPPSMLSFQTFTIQVSYDFLAF